VKPLSRLQSLPRTAIAVGVALNLAVIVLLHDQFGRVLAGGVQLRAPDFAVLARQSPAIHIHLGAALLALLVALYLLAGAKGSRAHRVVGWIWSALMMGAVASSFFIMELNRGSLSWIHILSGWTALAVPIGVWAARTHRVQLHRQFMTGLVVGGLVIAGALTFLPGRLMWLVFFG